jgi:hypothetical protein
LNCSNNWKGVKNKTNRLSSNLKNLKFSFNMS